MQPFSSPRHPIVSRLLMLAAFAATPSLASEAGPEDEFDAGQSSVPAATDPCLSALQAGAVEAERLCSDLIAGLRYEGDSGRTALPGALNNRATARMRSGDLEGATADLSEALQLAPDAWPLYLNQANLALMNGDAAAALASLGRLRELVPAGSAADAAADRNSVLAWRVLGNLNAASALFDRINANTEEGSSVVGQALSPELRPPAEPAPPPG